MPLIQSIEAALAEARLVEAELAERVLALAASEEQVADLEAELTTARARIAELEAELAGTSPGPDPDPQPEPEPEPEPEPIVRNGDFSEALTYWEPGDSLTGTQTSSVVSDPTIGVSLQVVPGPSGGGRFQVLEGLKPGDQGTYSLKGIPASGTWSGANLVFYSSLTGDNQVASFPLQLGAAGATVEREFVAPAVFAVARLWLWCSPDSNAQARFTAVEVTLSPKPESPEEPTPTGDWTLEPGQGTVQNLAGELVFSISQPGTATAHGQMFDVVPDERRYIELQYTGNNLAAPDTQLVALLEWFNVEGRNIDRDRDLLGFPPLARRWALASNGTSYRQVRDNIVVPSTAVKAQLHVWLERTSGTGVAGAAVRNIHVPPGEIMPEGLDGSLTPNPVDSSGLSTPPAGFAFAPSPAASATMEGSVAPPAGWSIQGDNSGNAASLHTSGGFSGQRALKVSAVGPYIDSFNNNSGIYVPGGNPGGNYASAREEVAARWVSTPEPAAPGQLWQSISWQWFERRQRSDAGHPNPARLQFLDSNMRVLPYQTVWDDWLPDERPFENQGWVRVVGSPVTAPAGTAYVRRVVVLATAWYTTQGGVLSKWPHNRGSVLVDNFTAFKVVTNAQPRQWLPYYNYIDVFLDTAAAGALPFMPTNPSHRPDSLSVESDTGLGGGIIYQPADHNTKPLRLRLQNWLGDVRQLSIAVRINDWQGAQVHTETVSANIAPYSSGVATIAYPANVLAGSYTISWEINEGGVKQDSGITRFSVLPQRETTLAEHARADYPFALWDPHTDTSGSAETKGLGDMAKAAGMGKTFFGLIPLEHDLDRLIRISNDADRQSQIAEKINECRARMAVYESWNVNTIGAVFCKMSESERGTLEPRLRSAMTQIVNGLKDKIKFWSWGSEYIGEWVSQLDVDRRSDGSYYLLWDHPGTLRQYFRTMATAYDGAKAADPTCVFGNQCASNVNGDLVRLFAEAGYANKIDAWGTNTYISYGAIWPKTMAELVKVGKGSVPLWAKEFSSWGQHIPSAGFPANDGSTTGDTRLADEMGMVRNLVINHVKILTDFPGFMALNCNWFRWNENSAESLIHDRRMRPHFVAFANMSNVLGAGRFINRFSTNGADVHVYQRSVRQGLVGVVWGVNGNTNVSLKTGAASVTVVDVMGNRRTVNTTNGTLNLAVTPFPQYILGASQVVL